MRKLPSYLAIRKFSDPPQRSDLDGFNVEPEDVKQLKDCKPGHCEVQLPAESMEEFQKAVNWSAPDAADQVNRVARRMALEALVRYIQGGNVALGTYRDKNHPAQVAETFQSLLSRSKALPAYLPDLDHYLLDYPAEKLGNVKSQFYWEKVNFGLKPTLSHCLSWYATNGASVCCTCETALRKPLFSNRVGSDHLRQRHRQP